MKLATYKDGSRDGQLVVVSRDLGSAHYANGIATRLQQVLDDWNFLSPQLEDLSATLNQGKARHAFPFEPRQCMAPLPRAYQWADGSAYPSHAARLCQAAGEALPEWAASAPMMLQGGSDDLLGPCDNAWFTDPEGGIDFAAELAVVTGDVARGASAEQALESVRLLMLANAWSLRQRLAPGLGQCLGWAQGRPAAAFSPVAVTPDELGEAWRGGRLHGTLQVACNGRRVGLLDAGADMPFHFGQLIAQLARTRRVRAGSIIGSGAVSNADATRGVACLAEKRALERLDGGASKTGWLAFGDRVIIEMKGRDGMSVFGAIDQRVTGPGMDDAAADEAAAAPAASAAEPVAAHATAADTPPAAEVDADQAAEAVGPAVR